MKNRKYACTKYDRRKNLTNISYFLVFSRYAGEIIILDISKLRTTTSVVLNLFNPR